MVRAGQIKRFQPGADDVVAKLLHRGWFSLVVQPCRSGWHRLRS
jgi:hypothetical protein